jgi:phosphate transport system substrate-binding protein
MNLFKEHLVIGEKMRKVSGVIAASALIASVALVGPAAQAKESITGSGSSYANLILQECRSGYTEHSVTYTSTGSSTGKTNFKNGTMQYGASDSLYSAGTAPSNFVYVPLIGGPIAIAYNVPGLKNLKLTPKLISDIFLGNITKWNDKAIAKVNAGVKLPSNAINVVYRKDGSGTSNNFTNYLQQVVGGSWKANDVFTTGAGKTVGTGADKSAGVNSTMKSLPYSIGYLDLADAATSGFGFAAVQNGAGQFVKPSVRSSQLFLAAQDMNKQGVVKFDYDAAVKGGYNISLVAYGLAPTASKDAAKGEAVKGFFEYVLKSCAPAKAAKLNYVALAGTFQKQALALVAKIK